MNINSGASWAIRGTALVRTHADITHLEPRKSRHWLTLSDSGGRWRSGQDSSSLQPLHQVRPGFRKRGKARTVRVSGVGYQGHSIVFLECRKFWTPPVPSEGWLAFEGRDLAVFTYFNELEWKGGACSRDLAASLQSYPLREARPQPGDSCQSASSIFHRLVFCPSRLQAARQKPGMRRQGPDLCVCVASGRGRV